MNAPVETSHPASPPIAGAAVNGAFLDRRWWTGALLACLAAVLAALAMPVSQPQGSGMTDTLNSLPEHAGGSAHEDLGAFLDSRRWGASLREILEAEAERARKAREAEQLRTAINPVLAKMGFVGLIVTGDRSEVLLESPEGGVARYTPGETLPDGRTLVSVTDNSLTLKGDDTSEEVLTLFPPVRSEPLAAADHSPAGGADGGTDAARRSE